MISRYEDIRAALVDPRLSADTIPDDGLLAAAKADKLKSADDIRTEVNRLLGTPLVQTNLTRVMLANYSVGSLFGSAKDAQLFPAYTPALETSLYTETKMFVDNVLWHGKITDLLTSRQTFIDENLAALYNVTYPAAPGGGFQPYTGRSSNSLREPASGTLWPDPV